jgi:hypothetical protein
VDPLTQQQQVEVAEVEVEPAYLIDQTHLKQLE